MPDRFELPPVAGVRYFAFVDPSGGSADSMTLAIAHLDNTSKRVTLDAIREVVPPFSPEGVVREFCDLCRQYRVFTVVGDRYGGEFCRSPFLLGGVRYDLSAKPKSDIYRDCLPLLNSGRVELLTHPKLLAQLTHLERRTSRGGRDLIDHPPSHAASASPNAHDDVANAVCGALLLAAQQAARRMQFTNMLTGQQIEQRPDDWSGCWAPLR